MKKKIFKMKLLIALPLLFVAGIIQAQTDTTWHPGAGGGTMYSNNHVEVGDGLTVQGKVIADSLQATRLTVDTMKISRIMPLDGDSIIHFGRHTTDYNVNTNAITWTTSASPLGFSIGNGTTWAAGLNNIAIGYDAYCFHDYALAFGNGAQSLGINSTALGLNAQTSGDSSMAIGYYANAGGKRSMAIGNNVFTSGHLSFAVGTDVTTNATKAFCIGTGVNSGSQLTNSTSNTLAIGFNSTIPTLFVSAASGAGTTGSLGVATSAPLVKLDVRGTAAKATTAAFQNLIAAGSNDASSPLVLQIGVKTDATASNRYGAIEVDDAGTKRNLALQPSGGNVGIGTAAPGKILDVVGPDNAGAQFRLYKGANIVSTLGTGTGTAGAESGVLQLYNNAGAVGVQIFSQGDSWITGSDVGIGTTTPGYKLDVQGGTGVVNINTNGNLQAAGTVYTSDQQFKIDVDTLQSALTIIRQFKPKSYYFDTVNYNGEGKFNFSSAKQYGFIAQEIEEILPELVSQSVKPAIVDTLGAIVKPEYTYKALNYIGFISILTKGIQELQQKNDSLLTKLNTDEAANNSLQEQVTELTTNNTSLQNQVNQLTTNVTSMQDQLNQLLEAVNSCCSATRSMQTGSTSTDTQSEPMQQIDVKLRNVQGLVLQNSPNPFKERTTINYTLPETYAKAQLLFYNSQGKLIQSVELTGNGDGQLNVFAEDLSSGIYTYTLVIDGKIVETKKMVKQ